MPHLIRAVRGTRWLFPLAFATCAMVNGCTGTISDELTPGAAGASGAGGSENPKPGGAGGAGGSGVVDPGNTGGTGTVTGPDGKPVACEGSEVTNAKRVIRLTFNQIANSLGSLLGAAFQTDVVTKFQIPDPTLRTFPPLANPREGSVLTDSQWQTTDAIAQAAGKYVFDNFASTTACGAAPTDACAQQFVATFAAKAFRRPLSDAEKTRLLKVYTDSKVAGSTVNEAVQYGVYAALQSPLFLYRTEFGGDATSAGPLSPSEMAAQLAMFLTDSPPDQPLLDAAAQSKLSSESEIKEQVKRILAGAGARKNMEAAFIAYFALPNVLDVVIDPAVAPTFNPGLANSMYHESELFIKSVLWGGKVGDLLTSRKSVINQGLATLYGVAVFPPAGVQLDADKFAPVELPENRAGILTQAAFLTSKARPNVPSVVGRGLIVNRAIVCQENPEPPANLSELIAAANALLPADASERDRADYRAKTQPCTGCHTGFDPYGLALQNYDVLGKFTNADPEGRPLDSTVVLPAASGGGNAQGAVDMANKLAASGSFGVCMAKNVLTYAMAEGSEVYTESCSTQGIANKFAATDQSFVALAQEVAASKGFTNRNAGAAQ